MKPEGSAIPPMKSPIAKRSVNLDGHKTSVSLENAFWDALKQIATVEKIAVHELIFKVNNERKRGGLSSALRLFVLEYYRQQAAAKSAPNQPSARPENKNTRLEPRLSVVKSVASFLRGIGSLNLIHPRRARSRKGPGFKFLGDASALSEATWRDLAVRPHFAPKQTSRHFWCGGSDTAPAKMDWQGLTTVETLA
jgi:predicted DNA-binding ribbon-helix-helix protein